MYTLEQARVKAALLSREGADRYVVKDAPGEYCVALEGELDDFYSDCPIIGFFSGGYSLTEPYIPDRFPA